MKIMVLSDNHGNWSKTFQIVKNMRKQVDYIYHCGDSEFKDDDPIWELVDGVVKGNMDYSNYPITFTGNTPEGKVYMTHGHLSSVNRDLERVYMEGKELGAKFIFFGHTHRLGAEMVKDILLVNPGSLNNSRGPYSDLTYALITLENSEVIVEFYNDEMRKLDSLARKFDRNKEVNQ